MCPDGSADRPAAPEQAGASAGDPSFEAGLYADGVTFEAADAQLLRTIDEQGSLNATTELLGRSYSRTHERIEQLESAFGPLVDPERGGSGGGGSELTARARRLLARFERLQTEFSGVAAVEETVYEGSVLERDGEIATIQTEAGRLRALAPPDTTDVQVTIRADTVTLQEPDTAPPATGTSARNQFTGTVTEIEDGESVVTATVDIGAETPLKALVTNTSAGELGIVSGTAVVASFKTTATRATPKQ